MIRRICAAFVALVLSVVGAVSVPAEAETGDLSDPAKSAASLDALRASDAELTKAIAVLDREVGTQHKSVEVAQRALDAAQQAVTVADQSLSVAERELNAARERAGARAASEYMRPRNKAGATALMVGGPANLEDVSRRSGFIREVTDRDSDAVDQLRARKIDLDRNRETALAARDLAAERRANEQKELDNLNAARAEKARLDESLKKRLAIYEAEDAASERIFAGSFGGRASRSGGDAGADGRTSSAGLQWPVASPSVSSQFGNRWGRLHAGIDLQATTGTPIYAAKSGQVISAGWEAGYGNYTCIDHGGGFSTCYAHQSSMTVGAGASVQGGQLIGYAGNTGASQAPHLHFETRQNGSPQNPMSFLP